MPLLCLSVLLGSLMSAPSVVGQPDDTNLSGAIFTQWNIAELEADLDDFFTQQMALHFEEENIAAATVAVVRADQLVYAEGFANADIELDSPIDPQNSLFKAGSVSKIFTWTAIMQLVEEGLISLDADVNEYLSDFKIASNFEEPIRVRHLMDHTSGFEDGTFGYRLPESEADLKPLAEAVAYRIPLRIRPPGQISSYSNYGTSLAGVIIENVSGMSFPVYMRSQIFLPLQMNNSSFREPAPERLQPMLTKSYSYDGDHFVAEQHQLLGLFAPAGSLTTSATDMAHFMIAHLQGGQFEGSRILQAATVALMHTRSFSHDSRLPGMAHGFQEMEVQGQRVLAHGGDTGNYHSLLALLPAYNAGLFVSYDNGGTESRMDLLRNFVARYIGEVEIENQPQPAGFAVRAPLFVGDYRLNRHNWSTFEKLLSLAFNIRVSTGGDGQLNVRGGGITGTYQEIEPFYFREIGSERRLVFHESGDNSIDQLFVSTLPFMAAYRAKWYQNRTFNLSLVSMGVLLSLAGLFASLFGRQAQWRTDKQLRTAHRTMLLNACLYLLFLTAFIGLFLTGYGSYAISVPRSMRLLLLLPYLMLVLSLVQLAFLRKVWQVQGWGILRRIHFTAFAVVFAALTWFYYYWNLYGFR